MNANRPPAAPSRVTPVLLLAVLGACAGAPAHPDAGHADAGQSFSQDGEPCQDNLSAAAMHCASTLVCYQPSGTVNGTCVTGASHHLATCSQSTRVCAADEDCQDDGATGTCVKCGAVDQVCCRASLVANQFTNYCGDGLQCSLFTCRACGDEGQPCCTNVDHGFCLAAGTSCVGSLCVRP